MLPISAVTSLSSSFSTSLSALPSNIPSSPLFHFALPIFLCTYCGAISLYSAPPPSPLLSQLRNTRNNETSDSQVYLQKQDRIDRRFFDIIFPPLTAVLTAHWALFWRRPTRVVARFIGWCLRDVVGDADDVWLCTEL